MRFPRPTAGHPSAATATGWGITATAFLLASCTTTDPLSELEKTGPVYGKRDSVGYTVTLATGEVKIGNLVRIGETVRKYKRLNASDAEIIRKLAQLKIDGLIVQELNNLKPKFQRKKAQVQKTAQQKIAKISATKKKRIVKTSASKPPSEAREEIAKIEAEAQQQQAAAQEEATQQIAVIDAEWKRAATQAIEQRYGSNFAVPVQNPQGKAVVAFATMKNDGSIRTAASAYELNTSPAALAAAVKRPDRTVAHSGQDYALLDVGPVRLSQQ